MGCQAGVSSGTCNPQGLGPLYGEAAINALTCLSMRVSERESQVGHVQALTCQTHYQTRTWSCGESGPVSRSKVHVFDPFDQQC